MAAVGQTELTLGVSGRDPLCFVSVMQKLERPFKIVVFSVTEK
jgi:hypothetical protein